MTTNEKNSRESKDSWPIKTINSWDEFEDIVSGHRYRDWIYRGHYDAEWEVNSSLYRAYDEVQFIFNKAKGLNRKMDRNVYEKLLVEKFVSHAHIYLNHLPDKNNVLEILSVMQHFGAPTRLIDVTFSPFVAMYFALELGCGDAAIFAIKPRNFTEIDKSALNFKIDTSNILTYEKEDSSFFIAYEPEESNVRLMAQQGLFIVPSKISEPFKNILGEYHFIEDECVKYLIPSKLRFEGIKRLKKLNITSYSLFPGIDGFCRSLRYQLVDSTRQLARIC